MLRVPSGAARCSSARKMSGLCKRGEIQEQGRIKSNAPKLSSIMKVYLKPKFASRSSERTTFANST